MKICIDIDGVICKLKESGQDYPDLEAIEGAAEKIKKLKEAGHYVILYTARHMKTCSSNVGQVIARKGMVTLQWLADHGIEYDEIYFGKPHADVYIDDNAYRFEGWDKVSDDGSSLPLNKEKQLAKQQKTE